MVAEALARSRSSSPRHPQGTEPTRRALERSFVYPEELDIDPAKGTDAEYFRWFLASLLQRRDLPWTRRKLRAIGTSLRPSREALPC